MFLLGRMLASGARLFIAAIPLCLLLFAARGQTNFVANKWQLIEAVCVIGLVGTFYTTLGGIRTVVWTDTIQFFIVVGAAVLSIALLLHDISRSPAQIARILAGSGKLRVFDFSFNLNNPFTVWAGVLGNTFLVTASLGVDQDFAQRFLVSKSPLKGAMSIVYSQIVGLVVSGGFMLIGLLLYIFYKRPDVMGMAAPHYAPAPQNAYPSFLLSELPTMVSGIAIAGFFAIAQGSMDSAINALASSAIADIYIPLRRHLGYEQKDHRASEAPKIAVLLMGVVMVLFAIVCIALYGGQDKRTLIDFALGVMAFAYSGMLGVFLTAAFDAKGQQYISGRRPGCRGRHVRAAPAKRNQTLEPVCLRPRAMIWQAHGGCPSGPPSVSWSVFWVHRRSRPELGVPSAQSSHHGAGNGDFLLRVGQLLAVDLDSTLFDLPNSLAVGGCQPCLDQQRPRV